MKTSPQQKGKGGGLSIQFHRKISVTVIERAADAQTAARLFSLKISLCQTAFAGFSVFTEQVPACLVHGLYYHIKGNLPGMVSKVSQTQSVNRPHGCHRISFDTGNLHQAADGGRRSSPDDAPLLLQPHIQSDRSPWQKALPVLPLP